MPKSMIDLQTNGKQVSVLDDADLLLAATDPAGTPDDAVIEWGDIKVLLLALFLDIATYDPAGIQEQLVGLTAAQTVIQKRITPRLVAVTQSATPAVNSDTTDIANITGLAQAITSMTTNLSGTPTTGQKLEIRITDNATARAISWGTSFASTTVTLPTTTIISTMLRIGLEWNAATSKWDCIAVA